MKRTSYTIKCVNGGFVLDVNETEDGLEISSTSWVFKTKGQLMKYLHKNVAAAHVA